MRDGLKKRIMPKTTIQKKNINTFGKYNVQYKGKKYQKNVVQNDDAVCKTDAACNVVGGRNLSRRRYYAPFRQPILGKKYQNKSNISFVRKINKQPAGTWEETHEFNKIRNEKDKCCEIKNNTLILKNKVECLWTQIPTDSYDRSYMDHDVELSKNPKSCPNSTKPTTRFPEKTNTDVSYSGNFARTNRPIVRSGMLPNTAGQQNSGIYNKSYYSYSYNELIKRRRKDTYVEQLPQHNKTKLTEICCSTSRNKIDKVSTRGNYSNDKFKVQGAVESSSRIDRLKLDTLKATNNKCSTNCSDVNKLGARSGLYFAGKPRFTSLKQNVTNFCNANLINSDTSNALRRVRGNTSTISNSLTRKCCKKQLPDENGFYVNGHKVNTNVNFIFKNSKLSYNNIEITYKKINSVTENQPYYLHEGEMYVPDDVRYFSGLLSYSADGNFAWGYWGNDPDGLAYLTRTRSGFKPSILGWIKISGECNSLKMDIDPSVIEDGFYISNDKEIISVETKKTFSFEVIDKDTGWLKYGKCKIKYECIPELLNTIYPNPKHRRLWYATNGCTYAPIDDNLLVLGEQNDVVTGRIIINDSENAGNDRIIIDDC